MSELELLEKFICDSDLKDLEKRFDKFNIFDCLRLTRTEIRHSNFLAWLLDPNETHGLKDYFLKEFLKIILINNKNVINSINKKDIKVKKYNSDNNETVIERYTVPSIFDIDYWDMQNTEILREHENIDLLIIDETNKFVFVIENKVDTCQHDNQLTKYRTYVDKQYPSEQYKKLYIYLKPQREEVEKPYIYVNYSLIKAVLDELINEKQDKISDEIITSIKHYKHIIERDFMQKDDISEICREIYKKHKKAIDLITRYTNITDILVETIENIYSEDLESLKKDGMFRLKPLENIDTLQVGNSKYGKDLLFLQLEKNKNEYYFCLNIVPAKKDLETKRKEIIEKFERRLNKKLINSDSDNTWCYYNFPVIMENEYFNFANSEKLNDHLKTKIDETKIISIIKEISCL